MKKIELWVPIMWYNALFYNDFTNMSEDEKYRFMDFMDARYLRHGTFTPLLCDLSTSDKMVIHDAMKEIKEHPIDCVKVTFSIDNY